MGQGPCLQPALPPRPRQSTLRRWCRSGGSTHKSVDNGQSTRLIAAMQRFSDACHAGWESIYASGVAATYK
jgi:hypothetical protein